MTRRKAGWILILLGLLFLLAGCGSTTETISSTATIVPPTPTQTIELPQLASWYTGTITDPVQGAQFWSVAVIDEDRTTGQFRGTIIFNQDGDPYPYTGIVDQHNTVTFTGTDDPWLQLSGALQADGIIHGYGTTFKGDTGSSWTLKPTPA